MFWAKYPARWVVVEGEREPLGVLEEVAAEVEPQPAVELGGDVLGEDVRQLAVSASSSPNTAATTMRPWGPVAERAATNPRGVLAEHGVDDERQRPRLGEARATPTSMSPTDNAASGR